MSGSNMSISPAPCHIHSVNTHHTHKKWIVHFKRHADYLRGLAQLSKISTPIHKIIPMPMIHAIGATFSDPSCLASLQTGISHIEPDMTVQLCHSDRQLPTQMPQPFSHAGEPLIPWGIRHIEAPRAWSLSTGSGVEIAVIDTGADYNHSDLKHALSAGYNCLHPHQPPYDDNGHGTHICGTIAAGSRQHGMVGVAPQATLIPVKAFDREGSARVSDILQALEWCIQRRVHIINMSFGMPYKSPAMYACIKKAHRAGIVIVASTGNEGRRKGIDFPARFSETISVGASTQHGKCARFSNRGQGIDIYAPGERIVSTWPGNRYTELSGTSMAVAHVSGIVALMLSVNGGLRTSRIRQLLQKNASTLQKAPSSGTRKEAQAWSCLYSVVRPRSSGSRSLLKTAGVGASRKNKRPLATRLTGISASSRKHKGR